MLVRTTAECRQRINALSTKTYPAGVEIDVPAADAERWIAAGTAVPTPAAAVKKPAPAARPSDVTALDLEALTAADLKEIAAAAGVALPKRSTKTEIIAALEAARAAKGGA